MYMCVCSAQGRNGSNVSCISGYAAVIVVVAQKPCLHVHVHVYMMYLRKYVRGSCYLVNDLHQVLTEVHVHVHFSILNVHIFVYIYMYMYMYM